MAARLLFAAVQLPLADAVFSDAFNETCVSEADIEGQGNSDEGGRTN